MGRHELREAPTPVLAGVAVVAAVGVAAGVVWTAHDTPPTRVVLVAPGSGSGGAMNTPTPESPGPPATGTGSRSPRAAVGARGVAVATSTRPTPRRTQPTAAQAPTGGPTRTYQTERTSDNHASAPTATTGTPAPAPSAADNPLCPLVSVEIAVSLAQTTYTVASCG